MELLKSVQTFCKKHSRILFRTLNKNKGLVFFIFIAVLVLAYLFLKLQFWPYFEVLYVFKTLTYTEFVPEYSYNITVTSNTELVETIFRDGLPRDGVNEYTFAISNDRYSFDGLAQIDRMRVDMDNGLYSVMYLFVPDEPNNELVVYHQGHGGDFYRGSHTIERLISEGYTVLGVSMPLLGMNNKPDIYVNGTTVTLENHNMLSYTETQTQSALIYFFEPVYRALNTLDTYDRVHMVGLSGGGWTTDIYSAIDPRIDVSISVAGSLPKELLSEGEMGDYEQRYLDSTISQIDIYALASLNGTHVQIFNVYDSCCFWSERARAYDDLSQKMAEQRISGTFSVYFDDSHARHIISDDAIDIILHELKKD